MSYWPILGIFKTASARGIIMGDKKSVESDPFPLSEIHFLGFAHYLTGYDSFGLWIISIGGYIA